VRDSLLEKAPSDWDVTTSAHPDEILSVFEDFCTIPTGIKHGTVTVLFDEEGNRCPIEITTFRIDGEYRDSRRPESVSFSKNIKDDLSRRDFTVNAMAYNEKEGIIDPFGGKVDLENKIIRAVGDPETRFCEDALRILRALRFSSQLEFEIEEKTLLALKSSAHLLKNIARERISAELKRMLASSGVRYALQKMIECGIWNAIFDISAPKIEDVEKISLLQNGSFEARLAILLSNCNDGEKDAFLSSLRLSNAEKKKILRLCGVRNFKADPKNPAKWARHFLHLYGDILSEALSVLSAWMKGEDYTVFKNAVLDENAKKRPLRVSDLAISGEDLLPLCDKDRAKVGKTLSLLLEAVIDCPEKNQKDTLLTIAKSVM
jgi:tRNA nucleotidyltransferase (CCA-adding enzyme)